MNEEKEKSSGIGDLPTSARDETTASSNKSAISVKRRTVIAAGATSAAVLAGGLLMRNYLAIPAQKVTSQNETSSHSKHLLESKSKIVSATSYPDGYGRDPLLLEPIRHPWPDRLDDAQLSIIEDLANIVLEGNESLPNVDVSSVVLFFDEWLTAPYPQQREDAALLLPFFADLVAGGFSLLDKDEQRTQAHGFHAESDSPMRRFTILAAGAFFTTGTGVDEIGFVGNIPQATFEGPSEEIIQTLRERLAEL